MKILVVTKSDDNDSIARVVAALRARGAATIRLDTDRYPHAITMTTSIGATESRRIVVDGAAHDLGDVGAVWYRRFAAGMGLPALEGGYDEDLRGPSVDEARRCLFGMIAALPCRHVDALAAVRKCDHKELQLVRARALGLLVPRTLFTNDPAAARAFFEECGGDVVTKMQSSFAVHRAGVEHVVFTSRVERSHLDDLAGLALCPMIFQQQVKKRLDVRATVVGERVLAASVDAGALDWRVRGRALVDAWRPHALPADVERALLALVRELGLHYAACDFVVDGAGAHWFLEANAGGEWFWLDDKLGIAGAIADVLTAA